MNFQTLSQSNSVDKNRIINANSWSACLAYLEGAGESISQISKLRDQVTLLLPKPNSNICYNVLLKDTDTQESSSYVIFQDTFSDLQTWIAQQTGKTVVSINMTEKTYVTV